MFRPCINLIYIYIYRAALFSPRVPNRHLVPSVQSPPRRTSPGAVRVPSHPRFSSPRGFPVAAVSVFFLFPDLGSWESLLFPFFFSFFRPGSWGSWLVAFYNRIQRLANLFDLVPLSARWKEFLIPYYIITDLFELSCDKSFLLSFIAVELGKASNLHSHLVVVTTSICFIHQWLVCLYHV